MISSNLHDTISDNPEPDICLTSLVIMDYYILILILSLWLE